MQFFAAFGFFFIVLQYLQFVAGLSPLEAALGMLPMPFVPLIPTSATGAAHRAAGRHQPDGAYGLTLIAAGLIKLCSWGWISPTGTS